MPPPPKVHRLFGIPGRGCALEIRVILAECWIAGHGEEAPALGPALQVIGGHVAADVQVCTGIADDDHATSHLRRTRRGVGLAAIGDRVDLPLHCSGRSIERVQPAIEACDVHTAFPHRNATIDDIAAGVARVLTIRPWVEGPALAAGCRIQRINTAPIAGREHHAVDDDRAGLQAPLRRKFVLPGKAQVSNVAVVDVAQRRIVAASEVATERQPVLRLLVRIEQPLTRNPADLRHVRLASNTRRTE